MIENLDVHVFRRRDGVHYGARVTATIHGKQLGVVTSISNRFVTPEDAAYAGVVLWITTRSRLRAKGRT